MSSEFEPIQPPEDRLQAVLNGTDRAYVTLKAAATLDGKIATRHGESQWITGPAARAHAMRLRAGHDAVLVGRGTVAADDPRLTVRFAADGDNPVGGIDHPIQPARVVLDSLASIDTDAHLLRNDGARRIVVVGSNAPEHSIDALRTLGAEVLCCTTPRPEPSEFLALLRNAGLCSILVEGGAQVHGTLIAQRVADALFLFLGGSLIGDAQAPGWCGDLGVGALAEAPVVRLGPPQILDGDILLHGWFG